MPARFPFLGQSPLKVEFHGRIIGIGISLYFEMTLDGDLANLEQSFFPSLVILVREHPVISPSGSKVLPLNILAGFIRMSG